MSDNRGRYGSLSDWLYKFVANVAQWDAANWRKREQIEMAPRNGCLRPVLGRGF